MQGNTEQHQLQHQLIAQLCGAICPEVWLGVEQLDLYSKMEVPKIQKRRVKERLKPYVKDQWAVDLLDRFLTLNPLARIDSTTTSSGVTPCHSPLRKCTVHTISHFTRNQNTLKLQSIIIVVRTEEDEAGVLLKIWLKQGKEKRLLARILNFLEKARKCLSRQNATIKVRICEEKRPELYRNQI